MRSLALGMVALALFAGRPALADTAHAAMCDAPPCTQKELAAYERRVVRHLLRVQQLRAEAAARGEQKTARHLDREFRRTQDRRAAARQAIERARD